MNPLAFMKSALSEADGSVSSSRICILLVFMFVLGAGASFVCKVHQTVTVSDVDSFLGAAGTFVATTCGPLYLINKGADAYSRQSQGGDDVRK